MKNQRTSHHVKPPLMKTLTLAIAAQTFATALCHAGPTGGTVVDGAGSIENADQTTRINQDSDRLSLQWDSFDVAADERVEFIQPSMDATALNRILDNNGSQILGQIDANGHVILMNPNGIFFGEDATVNVGGLVASGLNVTSEDFMNGDLAFAKIEGSSGAVINHGIIHAATGGNVALLGKTVANHGLISAELGHVALASGSEAVVTFDKQGLIGVRVDKETLASEVDSEYAVENSGTLEAKGGNILLNASVSADLFSQAVNRGDLSDTTAAVVHDDGSFTLGAGNSVINTGTADVSSDDDNAGSVVVAGDVVQQDGEILANAQGTAGQIYAEATDAVSLGASSSAEAISAEGYSGTISLEAPTVAADEGAAVASSGNLLLSGDTRLKVADVDANNLFIQSAGVVDQAGSVNVAGNTHLSLAAGAQAKLVDGNNDFNVLSLEAKQDSSVQLHDANDLILDDIQAEGAQVHVEVLGDGGSLSQAPKGNIDVYTSDLFLKADNLVLGEQKSSTTIAGSSVDLHFRDHINTNNSIKLRKNSNPNSSSARIVGTGPIRGSVEVTSSNEIDLAATFDERNLNIDRMVGDDASLQGYFVAEQTGPIKLSGTLDWRNEKAILENPENDIAYIQGTGDISFGRLNYTDRDDVTIKNIDAVTENSVTISSAGNNATIRQAENTLLKASIVNLEADNIELGAGGTSTVDAYYGLEIDIGRNLLIDGEYSSRHLYGANIRVAGSERGNRVLFGEHASVRPMEGGRLPTFKVDLGAGNDSLTFMNDLILGDTSATTVEFDMGSGNDALTFLGDFEVHGERVALDIDTGAGNDWLGFAGKFDVQASTAHVRIDTGEGNDWSYFLQGLTASGEPGDNYHVDLGQGNDKLLINGPVDLPVILGPGRDFFLATDPEAEFDLKDYDREEDLALVPYL